MKQLEPKTLLSVDAIAENLKLMSDAFLPKGNKIPSIVANVKIHDSISSTIDYIQKQPVVMQKLSVCLAEHQSCGRGRLGRTWFSPHAANIYLSLAWLSQQKIAVLSKLSLAVSLAVIKVLERLGVEEGLMIKWPNDIWWHGKKLAGILIETGRVDQNVSKIILSLGLNVNMLPDLSASAAAITQPWVSLRQILQIPQDRNKIVAMLLSAIYEILVELESTSISKILELWPQYDVLYGKEITFEFAGQIISGVALGINEFGYLQVQDQQGKIIAYAAGDVQLCR